MNLLGGREGEVHREHEVPWDDVRPDREAYQGVRPTVIREREDGCASEGLLSSSGTLWSVLGVSVWRDLGVSGPLQLAGRFGVRRGRFRLYSNERCAPES